MIASRYLTESRAAYPALKYVLPEMGMPLDERIAWADRYRSVRDATVLIQGTGTGWEVVSWARLKPKKIYAVDLFEFADWPEVAAWVRHHLGVDVVFGKAALEDLSFLSDASIDIVASNCVYEHCQQFDAVLSETWRVLAPNGIVYATYGPLWYCAGGDHFSSRDGLESAYNHLLLDEASYRKYFLENLKAIEDFQSGGRYVELDLFSKLSTAEYLSAYMTHGFALQGLMLDVSATAIRFRKRYPERIADILDKYPNLTKDDLVIKGHIVVLKKGTSSNVSHSTRASDISRT